MKKLKLVPALAGLAVAATLASPLAAQADPVFTATTDGQPVGPVGSQGQQILISGTGCIDPDTGASGYTGEFVSTTTDPVSTPDRMKLYENETVNGVTDLNLTIPLDVGTRTFYARWYCAKQPVEDIDSPDMLFVAPLATIQFVEPSAPQAARTTLAATQARTATTPAVQVKTDPDALPSIDKVNVPGAQAARLKAKVDKAAKTTLALKQRTYRYTRPRAAVPTTLTNQEYVETAFTTLTGRRPSGAAARPFVNRLAKGEVKVAIVEDIALTAHSAAWWTKNA